jgi:uncharacterized protein (DUF58 family)
MPAAGTAGLLGVSLLVAGLGLASPSLLVAGLALTLLAAVAIAWVELAAYSVRLLRAPAPSRVTEGDPYPLELEMVGGLVPPPGGELRDPLLERPFAFGPRWNGRLVRSVDAGRRGRRILEPARLELRDPLGLRTRRVAGGEPGELLVLPRIEPVKVAGRGSRGPRLTPLPGVEDAIASSRFDARAVEMEIDGLRPYRDGSPASRIHWPSVARSGELIERRLVGGADSGPLVILDASRPEGLEALDAAVRATASLCFALAAGGCAVLLPGDRRPVELEPDRRAWPQIHARLALVEPAGTAPAPGRGARSGAILWVTANPRPAVPTALCSGGPRYLVAPHELLHGPASFTVAGCSGRRLDGRTRVPRPVERAA